MTSARHVSTVSSVVGCRRSHPHLPELAREFGLRDELGSCKEIGEVASRRLIRWILHRDMAYNSVVMPEARAVELSDRFLGQFGVGARFFERAVRWVGKIPAK